MTNRRQFRLRQQRLPVVFGYNRHYYVGLGPTDWTFKVLMQFTSDYIVDVSGYCTP